MDSVPMVAITGNVSSDLLGLDSFQEVDITGITMPVTKHNFLVKDVENLADTIRRAFRIANTGRKGPVLVDIPKDLTAKRCEYTRSEPLALPKTALPKPERLEQALEMIRKSERPFLYAGGGVVASGANDALKDFAERIDAPVSCSLMCQGGYDQTDARYIGMLGMHGTNTSALAIKNCDLLIAVGTRFSDRVLCNAGLFAQHCPILQIDIDAAEFNKNIDVDLRLHGDAKEVLTCLNEQLTPVRHSEWMGMIQGWKALYPLEQKAPSDEAVTPKELMETLDRLTGSEAIIATEVGQHQMWAAQFYRFRHPRQFISSGGLGTMGFGLGAALGAQVANPDKRVVNIAGDGSFHMNCNELSTAAQYRIPVIELVVNNTVLGMVRQWQKLFYESRFSQTDLDRATDYEMLARAFGVKALTIRTKSDIEPVLKQALALNEPVLINCYIDPDLNVLPMVPAGGCVEKPILEM